MSLMMYGVERDNAGDYDGDDVVDDCVGYGCVTGAGVTDDANGAQ